MLVLSSHQSHWIRVEYSIAMSVTAIHAIGLSGVLLRDVSVPAPLSRGGKLVILDAWLVWLIRSDNFRGKDLDARLGEHRLSDHMVRSPDLVREWASLGDCRCTVAANLE